MFSLSIACFFLFVLFCFNIACMSIWFWAAFPGISENIALSLSLCSETLVPPTTRTGCLSTPDRWDTGHSGWPAKEGASEHNLRLHFFLQESTSLRLDGDKSQSAAIWTCVFCPWPMLVKLGSLWGAHFSLTAPLLYHSGHLEGTL